MQIFILNLETCSKKVYHCMEQSCLSTMFALSVTTLQSLKIFPWSPFWLYIPELHILLSNVSEEVFSISHKIH